MEAARVSTKKICIVALELFVEKMKLKFSTVSFRFRTNQELLHTQPEG